MTKDRFTKVLFNSLDLTTDDTKRIDLHDSALVNNQVPFAQR